MPRFSSVKSAINTKFILLFFITEKYDKRKATIDFFSPEKQHKIPLFLISVSVISIYAILICKIDNSQNCREMIYCIRNFLGGGAK